MPKPNPQKGKKPSRSQPDSPPARLRQIPSVEELLNRPSIQALTDKAGRKFVTARVRVALARVRQQILDAQGGAVPEPSAPVLESEILRATEAALAYSLQPVVNATGVILHTNLGRAPLAREALEHAAEIAGQYCNLEFDLAKGARGQRDVHVSGALEELLGAEAALVVNNNAAAVLIALNTLAEGGEVIVSRGELIEIGGSFRIPEIMQKSGAILREVGTTNRTRISDYQNAVSDQTRLLLRVHPSNFRIIGFTEKPSLREMVELGQRTGVPILEDLGSGCLVSLNSPGSLGSIGSLGILGEAPARESLEAGASLVSFSGDKLLGGPQAGILAGNKELVERIRRNPLFRALRVDKLTYAVLETTLQAYLQQQYHRVPTLRMIYMTAAEVESRARSVMEACTQRGKTSLQMELTDGESVIGGGSAPGSSLPTRLLSLHHATLSAATLESRLLAWRPPIVARVETDRVLIDLRTVLPEQEDVLAAALRFLASRSTAPSRAPTAPAS
ncbi:MAG: L-seryl-tRNA(Sec) selenium transferase [Acidobacteria bacterium]|nr:L-seryl-tRNA(Sec) selenium transferase [Acidobacteriota bacterium]